MVLVFLEDPLTLINVYEKLKIFELPESKKRRGKVDAPSGLKKFFSDVNISIKL